MKISKLSLRGKTYSYRSRVPEHLKSRFASNGNDPDKVIQISLKTHDPSIALARKKVVDDWVENGGLGLVDFVPAQQHYLQQLALVQRQPVDESFGIRTPIIDPSLIDGLQQGTVDPTTLTAETLAAIAATLADATGQQPPNKYKYSLRDALRDYKAYRQGQIKQKTLNAYDRAVDLFLGSRSDIALDAIQSPDVALWVDGLSDTLSYSSRKNHVNRLSKLFSNARRLGHCIDRRNPLEKQHLGMSDAKPVQQMLDIELLHILPKLNSDSDRAWAVLARHTGMRLAEICYAEIVVEDGVVCFSVREVTEADWAPKTDASTRLVPIRKSLIEYAREFQPKLKNPRDYSKRFGNVKRKLYPDRNRTLVFHSLRHTFITLAYQAGYTEQNVSWVSGHSSQRGTGESAKTYFHGYSIGFLSKIIEDIPLLSGF